MYNIILNVYEQEKENKTYKRFRLGIDLGYRVYTLAYMPSDISELLNVSISGLYNKPNGEYNMGVIDFEEK